MDENEKLDSRVVFRVVSVEIWGIGSLMDDGLTINSLISFLKKRYAEQPIEVSQQEDRSLVRSQGYFTLPCRLL